MRSLSLKHKGKIPYNDYNENFSSVFIIKNINLTKRDEKGMSLRKKPTRGELTHHSDSLVTYFLLETLLWAWLMWKLVT